VKKKDVSSPPRLRTWFSDSQIKLNELKMKLQRDTNEIVANHLKKVKKVKRRMMGGSKKYSDEDFAKDLKELEKMIENYSGGMDDTADVSQEMHDMDMDSSNVEGVNDVLDRNLASDAGLFGGKSSSKKSKNKKNEDDDEDDGKKRYRVVSLNGEEVKIGKVSIGADSTPLRAAKKLLRSIASHKGLSGSRKGDLKSVVFEIKEITRGSSKKTYGPYVGKYKKYSPEEIKKASYKIDGKVIKPSMKAVVKLHKHHVAKKDGMKGGK
jgi:hypothetical protein